MWPNWASQQTSHSYEPSDCASYLCTSSIVSSFLIQVGGVAKLGNTTILSLLWTFWLRILCTSSIVSSFLIQVGGVAKLGITVVLTFTVMWLPWASDYPQAVLQVCWTCVYNVRCELRYMCTWSVSLHLECAWVYVCLKHALELRRRCTWTALICAL